MLFVIFRVFENFVTLGALVLFVGPTVALRPPTHWLLPDFGLTSCSGMELFHVPIDRVLILVGLVADRAAEFLGIHVDVSEMGEGGGFFPTLVVAGAARPQFAPEDLGQLEDALHFSRVDFTSRFWRCG